MSAVEPASPMELPDCPPTPNCVCSTASRLAQRVAPLPFQGDWQVARDRLIALVQSLPRTKIVTVDGPRIHATFTSLLFKFVDDVQFFIEAHAGVIHIRSASRTGYSDLGVNRRRVEEIRRRWDAKSR
jgi:uncharacterized protein (DUF1499 family)